MFDKVLIANRGEIAVRVARACRELGVAPVAVFSEPDRLSPHVLEAEESVHIGPARASDSYLDMEKLIGAAREVGAGAIHPGYGFLAENGDFARRVEGAGLTFVGPSGDAIDAMGNKTEARQRMEEAGVPVIPGSESAARDEDEAREAAGEVGFPVMLKAAAGGGGKGMRIVRDPDELGSAFRSARSEAEQAFGDGRVYVERFLDRPRHIEIQVMADGHGDTVHLGERECSIQRRHQKLVEEAPSAVIDEETRARMGEVAVRAARAVDYRNAGTVEFLYQDGEFFFLEMNTRIQVEHPVTEMVTGVDLVREQLRVAAGEPLGFEPDPEWPRGHAIECRISGEDPSNRFLPSTGRVETLREPSGPGVRWDGGIAEGFEVGLDYDPLLAKLVVHDESREAAVERMRRALEELEVSGLSTTQPFHLEVMDETDFRNGNISISYVDDHPEMLEGGRPAGEAERAARVAAVLLEEEADAVEEGGGADGGRPDRGRDGRSSWRRAFDPR